jgi:hypothetical protein
MATRICLLRILHGGTEMSTWNLSRDKRQSGRKADNLTAICEPTVCRQNVGASTSHNRIGLHGLLTGLVSLTILLSHVVHGNNKTISNKTVKRNMVYFCILRIPMSLTYFEAFQLKVTEHKPISWDFTVEWVPFLHGIRKLTGSNTGCDIDYLDRGLLWFSSVPTCNRDSTSGYTIAASFHIFTNSLTNFMKLSPS